MDPEGLSKISTQSHVSKLQVNLSSVYFCCWLQYFYTRNENNVTIIWTSLSKIINQKAASLQ